MKGIKTSYLSIYILVCILTLSCTPIEPPEILSLQQRCFRGDRSFDDELISYGHLFLDSLCSYDFQGRKVGTKGWEKSCSFLLSEIKEMGFHCSEQDFFTEQDILIKNIIVTIPGQIDSTIIIGAHFDGAQLSLDTTHYPAANDNGSGVTTQMLLLKTLSQRPLNTDRTIKIIFWGCEEVLDGRAFRGSHYYAQNLSQEDKSFLLSYINIDTVGHQLDENELNIEHSGESRVEAAALRAKDIGRFNYIISKRITNLYSDNASFYIIKIPFLNFHDNCQNKCAHPVHSTTDIPEAISIERLHNIASDIIDIVESY